MKEKIIRALTAIFSVTIFVVMLLALLIAVIYIYHSLYSRSTIFRGAVRIFRCLYSEAIYIATIIDCLPGVVIMYLKKQYVFVLDMGAKSK